MRAIVLVTAIFVPAVASASANLPFAPISPQPDYVVTMGERMFAMDFKRSVTHHGGWTRVDRIGENYRSTNYYSVNGAVAVHDQRSALVTSFARAIDLSYRDYRPRRTGERQAHLGETCTVWEVSRTITDTPNGSNSFHLSCITDDGIELWQRSIYGSNVTTPAVATRVERRPVTADEVKPSRSLLTLDWWDRDAPSTIPGTETMMELSAKSVGAGKSMRITRQRGAWQSIEETVSGVHRRLEIVHDSDRRHFEYVWDESGSPDRLTITRPPSTPADPATTTSVMWNDMNRSETILGVTCRWFYLVTNGYSGRSRCLTNDGVVLKDRWQGRSFEGQEVVQEWTAVRMTRRPIGLDEIKPPAELLEPQRWGIE